MERVVTDEERGMFRRGYLFTHHYEDENLVRRLFTDLNTADAETEELRSFYQSAMEEQAREYFAEVKRLTNAHWRELESMRQMLTSGEQR